MEELCQIVLFLENVQEEEQKVFFFMLYVFFDISELCVGLVNGQFVCIVCWCEQLGLCMGMNSYYVKEMMMVGMLYGIGKLDLFDELVKKFIEKMSSDELQCFLWYLVKGQMLLIFILILVEVGEIICYQYECYDGCGVLESLLGDVILLGLCILVVVCDFEGLCNGGIISYNVSFEKVFFMLCMYVGYCYDLVVVNIFIVMMEEQCMVLEQQICLLFLVELWVGMKLVEDLCIKFGVLLLNKEYVLDEVILVCLWCFEQIDEMLLKVRIVLY